MFKKFSQLGRAFMLPIAITSSRITIGTGRSVNK